MADGVGGGLGDTRLTTSTFPHFTPQIVTEAEWLTAELHARRVLPGNQ